MTDCHISALCIKTSLAYADTATDRSELVGIRFNRNTVQAT
jgi:hypothetical protein